MAQIEARNLKTNEGWTYALPAGLVTLGKRDGDGVWVVPRDELISGRHASLTWHNGTLRVQRLATARNPIFFKGEEQDDFTATPGDFFVIGRTKFTLLAADPDFPVPDTALTYSAQELQTLAFVDPEDRIEALSSLPDVIRHAPTESDLEGRVLDVLLRGIPRAGLAAVVRLLPDSSADDPRIEVRATRSREAAVAELKPSRRLVYEAIARRRQGVLHTWHYEQPEGTFTLRPGDWGLCVPLTHDAYAECSLYVAGRLPEARPSGGHTYGLQKGDLKFTELVGQVFGALHQILDLQRRKALLSRFFSQPVLAAMEGKDIDEVLQARETEVTVLFCDLRGSCRLAEDGQQDLNALWGRVSEALNVMGGRIIDSEGVIGDFQGDAAMGFWGWPLPHDNCAERAARAAWNIHRHFATASQQPGRALAGFQCGIGIATGRAIAGKLGTLDQCQINVFGPTPNLAARLESMTKLFRVPILLDGRTAELLGRGHQGSWSRCRRIGRLQPFGMTTRTEVFELMPPAGQPSAVSEQGRRDYAAALDAFEKGNWGEVPRLLASLPRDGPSEFLRNVMQRHGQSPPATWDGTIVMEGK